jgi:hypothetical protein
MSNVKLDLTPAQARCFNSALAQYATEKEQDGQHPDVRADVLENAWSKLTRAMIDAGVDP